MKKDKDQFPSCDSCGKPISGDVNVVKSNKSAAANQNFHKTPEECAATPSVTVIRKGPGVKSRTSKQRSA